MRLNEPNRPRFLIFVFSSARDAPFAVLRSLLVPDMSKAGGKENETIRRRRLPLLTPTRATIALRGHGLGSLRSFRSSLGSGDGRKRPSRHEDESKMDSFQPEGAQSRGSSGIVGQFSRDHPLVDPPTIKSSHFRHGNDERLTEFSLLEISRTREAIPEVCVILENPHSESFHPHAPARRDNDKSARIWTNSLSRDAGVPTK